MKYDPIADEDKKLSLYDFIEILVWDAFSFYRDFQESSGDFMKGQHTMAAWMAAFSKWRSW